MMSIDADIEVAAESLPRSPFDRPIPWGGGSYGDGWRRQSGFTDLRQLRQYLGTPTPTRRLDDADVIELAGREWVAVHTPGHTPDHLCLLDPAGGVLLSGDHVLPTITPHISGLGTAADPLAQFFASLDRMQELEGVGLVLPAHGHPFTDLAGRARTIQHHHEERLDLLRKASHELGRPATVDGAVHPSVLAPGAGAHGRQRDLRPPRAPPPRRRGRGDDGGRGPGVPHRLTAGR